MVVPSTAGYFVSLPHRLSIDVLLWYVDLDRYASAVELTGVSTAELASAQMKVSALDRTRYLASRHALRRAIGGVVGLPPAQLGIHADAWGRPMLEDGGEIDFNLSHSEHIGLIGVCLGQSIGVDIETIRGLHDAGELAGLHFTDAERSEWSGAGLRQAQDFLTCWTRKEACLKALGVGLSGEPSAIEAGCAPRLRTVSLSLGSHRCEAAVDSVDVPGHAVASVAWTKPANVAVARQFFQRT
jgi:4'-phosphopantetheinyl transferase